MPCYAMASRCVTSASFTACWMLRSLSLATGKMAFLRRAAAALVLAGCRVPLPVRATTPTATHTRICTRISTRIRIRPSPGPLGLGGLPLPPLRADRLGDVRRGRVPPRIQHLRPQPLRLLHRLGPPAGRRVPPHGRGHGRLLAVAPHGAPLGYGLRQHVRLGRRRDVHQLLVILQAAVTEW